LRTSAREQRRRAPATRSNGNFITGAVTLLQDGQVPTTPESSLERFLEHLPEITPRALLARSRRSWSRSTIR
jgi:zinc protease